MFRTSAKISMFALRVLQARRLTAGPHDVSANDNRPARTRRRPLVCRWSLADDGKHLVCRWEEEADAPEPNPSHQSRSPQASPHKFGPVTELSYSGRRLATARSKPIATSCARTMATGVYEIPSCCAGVTQRCHLTSVSARRLPIAKGFQ